MDHIDPDAIAAIEALIGLINRDPVQAQRQAEAFRASLGVDFDEFEVDLSPGPALLWRLKEVVDWKSGYFVDWKDTESFVGSIDALSDAWGVGIAWPTGGAGRDDARAAADVPTLMRHAHAALAMHGLDLWQWDTEGDCYGGWLARCDDAPAIQAISRRVRVEFRTGDAPF